MKSALGTQYRSKIKRHQLNPKALPSNEPDFQDRPLQTIRLDLLFKRMEELRPNFRQAQTQIKNKGKIDVRESHKNETEESMVIRGNRGNGVKVELRKDQRDNLESEKRDLDRTDYKESDGQRDTRERKPRIARASDRDGTHNSSRRSGYSDILEIKNMLSTQNEINTQHFKVLKEGQQFNRIEVQGIKSDVNSLNDRVKNLEYNVKNLENRDTRKAYRYSKDKQDSQSRNLSGQRIHSTRISYHDHRRNPKSRSDAFPRDNRHTYSERAIRDEYNSLQTQTHSQTRDPFSFSKKNRQKWSSNNLRRSDHTQKISKSRSPKNSRGSNLKNSKMEVVSEVSEPKSDQANSSKKNSQSKVQESRVSDKKNSSGGQLDKSSEIIFFGNNATNFIYSTEQSQISIFIINF